MSMNIEVQKSVTAVEKAIGVGAGGNCPPKVRKFGQKMKKFSGSQKKERKNSWKHLCWKVVKGSAL